MRIKTCICCCLLMVLSSLVFQVAVFHSLKEVKRIPITKILNKLEVGFKNKIKESISVTEDCLKAGNSHCTERESIEDNDKMDKPYSLVDQAVFPINKYNVLHTSQSICSSQPAIMIAIYPSADQLMYRYVIRQTLRKYREKFSLKYEITFFIGKSENKTLEGLILEEGAKYNDIVQFNTSDTFISKSNMHVLSFLWLQNNCQSISYYINLDIRTFINIKHIINKDRNTFVKINKGAHNTAFGQLIENEEPNRDPFNRKSIFKEIYPANIFPPYLTNRLSVWPALTIDMLVEAVKHEMIIPLDEQNIGILCKKKEINLKQLSSLYLQKQFSLDKKFLSSISGVGYLSEIDLFYAYKINLN